MYASAPTTWRSRPDSAPPAYAASAIPALQRLDPPTPRPGGDSRTRGVAGPPTRLGRPLGRRVEDVRRSRTSGGGLVTAVALACLPDAWSAPAGGGNFRPVARQSGSMPWPKPSEDRAGRGEVRRDPRRLRADRHRRAAFIGLRLNEGPPDRTRDRPRCRRLRSRPCCRIGEGGRPPTRPVALNGEAPPSEGTLASRGGDDGAASVGDPGVTAAALAIGDGPGLTTAVTTAALATGGADLLSGWSISSLSAGYSSTRPNAFLTDGRFRYQSRMNGKAVEASA